MKTLTEYRDTIKALLKKADDIKAKAEREIRDPSQEELALTRDILEEVESIRNIVRTQEWQERIRTEIDAPANAPLTKPGPRPTNGNPAEDETRDRDRFPTPGSFFHAVIRAGTPGGTVDARLRNTRAASGLGETVPSDGGFLMPSEVQAGLMEDPIATGLLASRCRRITIGGNANSIKLNGFDETSRASTRLGGIAVTWLDEAAEKSATKPKFRQIELSLKKVAGICYLTDELLQDVTALDSYVRTGFSSEMGFALDDVIVNGTGSGQPLGILNAGSLVTVSKETGQSAATVLFENIIKMWSRLFASSRPSAVWLINQNVEPQLFAMSMAVGTGGVPVYMPAGGVSGAPYSTLFGRPVLPIEHAATLGTVGDVVLADFANGYIIAEKGGVQAAQSIHVRFIYDETVLRFTMRLDGQPTRAVALTPYKGGASYTQSHFIALETRS